MDTVVSLFPSRVQGLDCGEEAARWLSDILGRQCRLVRQNPDSQRKARKQPGDSLSDYRNNYTLVPNFLSLPIFVLQGRGERNFSQDSP